MQALKKHLMKGKKITPIEAEDKFGCMRLSGRIYDLKHSPHNLLIEKKLILTNSGKRVAQYKLLTKNQNYEMESKKTN